MNKPCSRLGRHLLCFGIIILGVSITIHAQFQGGNQRNVGGNRVGGTGGGRALGGAGAASRQYYGNGMVGEAMVTSDPETRRLIVITDDETSQYVSQVITNLDQPKPQVLINVVFLEVTYRDALDFGVESGTTRKLGSGATSLMASNLFGINSQGPNPQPPGAGLYTLTGDDFSVTLRAIAEKGKTEILSTPSILARNNQQATITVGQSIPFVTGNTSPNLNGQIFSTVTYRDIGIILRVTPFITSDDMVEMIVSPEISSLTDQSITTAPGVSSPVIAKRSADTVVVTPDGKPVVIGGLMQNDKRSTDNKIPWLGDIPWLGNLFKRQNKANSKTELMIFLTPHIVRYGDQLASLTKHERDNKILIPRAFPEGEVERYLNGSPTQQIPRTPSAPPSGGSIFPPGGK